MTLRRLLVPLLVVALASLSCTAISVAAATVNGVKITEREVEAELDRVRSDPTFQDLLRQQADQVRGFARRQILNGLIRQQILGQEATKRGVKVTAEQIERLISQEAQRVGLSVEELRKQQNLSQKDLQELASRVVREFELKRRVVTDAGITERDVESFYEQNKGAFEEAHLERITVRTQADAGEVLQELGSRSFAVVAEDRSIDAAAADGGDLGFVPLSELGSVVQSAVSQVAVGRVTDPIPSAAGFEIYRVVARRTVPLADVEDRIRAQLGSQSVDARFQQWVVSRVRNARVVVNPKYGRFDAKIGEVVAGTGKLAE
jgi:peptidyl-prolyl cis-trans isomerase SurA